MILRTFGCSHTQGAELKYPYPSSWPYLLGNKLNLETKNYGFSGSSNEEIIYNAISNSPKNEKSLIVILSTYIDRVFWANLVVPRWKHYLRGELIEKKLKQKTSPYDTYLITSSLPSVKSWVKYHYNEEKIKAYQKFLIESCIELLKSRGHVVFLFSLDIENNFSNNTTFTEIVKNYSKGPGGHWLEEAQIVWADYIYNIIKNDNMGNICTIT